MGGYTDFAAVYDPLTFNVDYPAMADRLCGLLDRYGGDRSLVLDLACGTGSLTRELLGRGCDVIGADASPEMLGMARQKLAEEYPQTLLLCQPMERLDLYGTVTAVVCTLDSLNHLLSPAALQRALARAALFLEPNGLFLFDLNTLYKHDRVLGDNTFVYDRGQVFCVWQNRCRPQRHTVDITLDLFVRSGSQYRRYTERFAERAYSDEQLAAALDAAGLELLERFDGYTEQPVGPQTERALYITRKRP